MTSATPQQIRDLVFDSIVDGVFAIDRQWRIICFNPAAEQISGVRAEAAMGQQCRDVLGSRVCAEESPLGQTMRTGRPMVCQSCYLVDAAGQNVPVSISTAVLKDPQGQVVGAAGTFRDLGIVEQLRKELMQRYSFADIVSRSPAMRDLLDILPQVAESSSTVLVEGASGTGKELVARALHDLSPRAEQPFVAVNCAALPDSLLESELFGHKAGAFTDARQDKPGRFAMAHGGTIFLDEIGDISPAMQAKLLRVLQERVYEPLGSVAPTKVDVRVVAATNRELDQMVAAGEFRQDLYYRIKVVRLQLPSLCQRRCDIPLLVDHFISKFNQVQGKNIVGVSQEVTLLLMGHDYPGNIRELENIIEHAFVLCPDGMIQVHHLPPEFRQRAGLETLLGGCDLTLRSLETLHIAETLRRYHGDRDATAKALGIHRATLFRKIKSLDISAPAPDS